MKQPLAGASWFFVDESGDPTFYDRQGNFIVGQVGCSPILILGFVETQNPESVRQAVLQLQQEVIRDPYFQDFPSLKKTAVAFHAKDDVPEIRYRFFNLLSTLDFTVQFVVVRKINAFFATASRPGRKAFYDHLVSRLFQNALHRHQHNLIYFAKRGSRTRQEPLANAIRKGIADFEEKWHTHVARLSRCKRRRRRASRA